jgi:hypothetical protein
MVTPSLRTSPLDHFILLQKGRRYKSAHPYIRSLDCLHPSPVVLKCPLTMKTQQQRKRPPRRRILLLCALIGLLGLAYLAWSPGQHVYDGRHDRRTNGIWIQHGWLGGDLWFQQYRKDETLFRNDQKIQELADLLANHGVRYVFPHVCPCSPNGKIAPVEPHSEVYHLGHMLREGIRMVDSLGEKMYNSAKLIVRLNSRPALRRVSNRGTLSDQGANRISIAVTLCVS